MRSADRALLNTLKSQLVTKGDKAFAIRVSMNLYAKLN